jgi:hypothetical protein
MRLGLFAVACVIGLAACVAPPTQAQRVTDAARELNLATRFGRLDMALGHTSKGAQQAFLERRNNWGKDIRIVDVELAGLAMQDEMHATIQVDVAWVRVNDDTLRTTRILQAWLDDGGWHLVRETRQAGEIGLFGEPVKLTPATPHDVQYQSVTIQ